MSVKKPPFDFQYAPGATPLDPNEIGGLLADYISTQGELNQLEQQNIIEARVWAMGKVHKSILSDAFLRGLHKRMFKNVWRWAGRFRTSDKSIGVPWDQVPTELIKLLSDTRYWIDNKTYPWDELGARFHHRLVLVHAFSNGNGRHARLMTDILLKSNGVETYSWGADQNEEVLGDVSEIRAEYIEALREADQRKYDRLLRFVRS